jgi:Uma2 family endonuclease
MNIQLRPRGLSVVTQAAEGVERRRWTVAEIEDMVQAGIIDEDERFELIGGEVMPMEPKAIRHEIIKVSLLKWWMRRLISNIEIAQETTFRLSESSFLEPDFVFFLS